MPSLFPEFRSQLEEIAALRNIRVGNTYLKRQQNAIGLRGEVKGKLYVSQNRYARNWSVTQSAVKQLRDGESSWAIILLHKKASRGFLLTPAQVASNITDWKLNRFQGRYQVQAKHSEDTFPFLALDELLGMLRVVLGSQ